jgi:thiol-disulfide isomerase/thioredoxin
MIADGPCANRPPHILLPSGALESVLPVIRSLKLAVLGLSLAILGCNRESGEKAQPQPSASPAAQATAGPARPSGALDRSHKGSAMPDIMLADQSGKTAQLTSFKGKPLLVNLWATWCAPCVVELPGLDKLAVARTGRLKVLSVSQDMSNTEKVAPFLAGKAPHLEPWLDPKNDLAMHIEASTLPTTIYYDASGREVWRYVGDHDWTSAETAALLAEAH